MLGILGYLVGLGSLICFVIVLIKQFQTAGAVHGIIGILTCGIWTFIWGWLNADRGLNIKKLMWIWTLLIIVCIIVNVLGGTFFFYGRH
jgi:hypothetical protein